MKIKLLLPVLVAVIAFPCAAQQAQDDEIQPVFRGGGIDTFIDWVQKHVMYQDFGFLTKSGVVSVSFTIDKKGKIRDVETQSSDSELEREVRIMIGRAPKMTPGTRDGQPAEFRWELDIEFSPAVLIGEIKEEDAESKYPDDDLFTFPCFTALDKENGAKSDHKKFIGWIYGKVLSKSKYLPDSKVLLTFVLNEGGYPENVLIEQGTNRDLNKLIMEVIYKCPRWYSPAIYDGEPIKSTIIMPLRISSAM